MIIDVLKIAKEKKNKLPTKDRLLPMSGVKKPKRSSINITISGEVSVDNTLNISIDENENKVLLTEKYIKDLLHKGNKITIQITD